MIERRVSLTPRQAEIVVGLCDDLPAKQIASTHHLTVATVRWHIRVIASHLPPEYQRWPATKAIRQWATRTGWATAWMAK